MCTSLPSSREERVPVVEDRPRDLDHAVPPITIGLHVGAEHVREAGSAGEASGTIHHQKFAMIAHEHAWEGPPPRYVEKDEINTSGSQARPVSVAKTARTERIE